MCAYPHGRQTKQFFPCVRPTISKEMIKLPRHNVGRLIRLMSSHNGLNYHCHVKEPNEISPECRFCGTRKDTFCHFITDCPSLLGYRANIFYDYVGPKLDQDDWSVNDVFKFSFEPEVSEAIDYYGQPQWSDLDESDT